MPRAKATQPKETKASPRPKSHIVQIVGDGRAVQFRSENMWSLAIINEAKVSICLVGIGDVALYGSCNEQHVERCYNRLLRALLNPPDSPVDRLVIEIDDMGEVSAEFL